MEETALAHVPGLGHGVPVLPVRWFSKDGKLWMRYHRMRKDSDNASLLVDGRTCYELPVSHLRVQFPTLCQTH